MKQSELKHSITVDPNAKFIRFYKWLVWADSDTQITFCSLFWVYVFVVPLSIIGVIVRSLVFIGDKFSARHEAKKAAKTDTEDVKAPKPTKVRVGPSRAQRFITSVETIAAKTINAGRTFWDFISSHRLLNMFVLGVAGVIAATAALAVVGGIVYVVVTNWSTAVIFIISALGAVFLITVLVVMVATGAAVWLYTRIMTPAGHGIKGGALGFGGAMRIGFRAVKTNTCPRIEFKK